MQTMQTTCTRTFEFDAGHRIVGHESKCKYLHGHRYKLEVTLELPGEQLDSLGRILDFGEIKARVGAWIDTELDHNLILFDEDPLVKYDVNAKFSELHGRPIHTIPFNPTAENLVRYLFRIIRELLKDSPVVLVRTKLWETPNCWAEYQAAKED